MNNGPAPRLVGAAPAWTATSPAAGSLSHHPAVATGWAPDDAVNVHSFTRITPAPQLPDASDPVPNTPVKLLRIELERLRAMEKIHLAVIDRIMDCRDQWRETEKRSA